MLTKLTQLFPVLLALASFATSVKASATGHDLIIGIGSQVSLTAATYISAHGPEVDAAVGLGMNGPYTEWETPKNFGEELKFPIRGPVSPTLEQGLTEGIHFNADGTQVTEYILGLRLAFQSIVMESVSVATWHCNITRINDKTLPFAPSQAGDRIFNFDPQPPSWVIPQPETQTDLKWVCGTGTAGF